MKLPATALLVLLFISSVLLAQNGFYKTYTLPSDGASGSINYLYQDSKGYILVAATTGLYRFDGLNFYRFLQDNNVPDDVTAICETKDGKTWVGFADGKLGWLQQNKLVLQNPEEGVPAKTIKKIIQDAAGVVWIATAGEGIYYFTNNHFYNINTDDGLSDNYVYDIAIDRSGIFAGTDGGINECRIQNGKKIITAYNSRKGLPDNIVRSVELVNGVNKYPYLYIGMQDAGIGKYFPQSTTTAASKTLLSNWSYGQINDLLLTGNSLYVASENAGLLQYTVGNNAIAPKPEMVWSQKITVLLKDTEGNVWAAGNNNLIRTNGNKLQPLVSLTQAEAGSLHTLLVDKDNHIWYNVPQGLKHLEILETGHYKERIFQLPVSINSQVTALYEDRFGNIWIGTMGNGAFLLDPTSGNLRKITEDKMLSTSSVLSITGKDNQVWIASLEGAVHCQLQPQNANIQEPLVLKDFTSISGIGTNYIYNIFIDSKNRTWFATDGKGIAVYENGSIKSYNKKQGLKSEVIYQVGEDRHGNIWFSSFNAGMIRFDGKQFRHFTTADGLSDMNVTSFAADRQGNLYITHRNGIDIINTTTNTISYIDNDQGLADINTDLNTIISCSNGDICFSTGKGIYRYHVPDVSAQPKIVIDRVQLFLSDIDAENGHVFAASEDNISFYYTGLFYSQPAKIQYQYKLEGFADEWIMTSDRRRDFPKLAPGTYTFRVKASLNRNFENAPEASFTFTIQKPLWMRWWFIMLLFTAMSLILYFYIKGREKRLQNLERLEKEKIQSQFETLRNQVNPHFLFNSFNTLISEIEDDPKRAVEYVEHMADFFRSIVTYREKDVISLDEEIGIINDYLFIQRKRYGNAFRVHITIPQDEQQQYYLAPLTLQLLAENAIKHNAILKERPLVLEIFTEAGQLVVRNNISPKLHPEKSAGLGLQNIHKRYELLTKKPVIVTHDDEYFTVIIPLIKLEDGKSIDY